MVDAGQESYQEGQDGAWGEVGRAGPPPPAFPSSSEPFPLPSLVRFPFFSPPTHTSPFIFLRLFPLFTFPFPRSIFLPSIEISLSTTTV